MATDSELADVLSEFARTMVTDFPIQSILDHLVKRIVEIMPVTSAGVTLIGESRPPLYAAASNEEAMRFERLQTELGEGPRLAAYATGEPVEVSDLHHEERYPRFVPAALEAGLRAVFAFPLRHGEMRLGALDLYRSTPGELSAEAMVTAQTLADVAAAYLINAQARDDLLDSSDRARHLALHDSLTGLPNRLLLLERLGHAFLRSRRSQLTPAVFFIDLDRFKTVNDTHGHRTGDELLVAVAKRLSSLLRSGDTLARLSGDEFVIVCEDVGSGGQVDVIAARLNSAMTRPFELSDAEVLVSASIGIAFADGDDVEPEQVLHDADRAMYRAKRAAFGGRHVFNLREQQDNDHPAGLERELHQAIARGELYVEYQPVVATVDGWVSGAEALLRWAHPSRGLVPPSVLIPIAEQFGLIAGIGQWVLERAWAERLHWTSGTRAEDLAVAVNVSANQLLAPGFVDLVAGVVATSVADPNLLQLEITESVFVRDSERAKVVLRDLKDIGVGLALDDFGTGYSSLNHLMNFPMDIVKIDREFIAELGERQASRAIVAAVIGLAHDLDMTVVALGVENVTQHRELAELGCDSCQGHYFARPMTAATFEIFVRQRDDELRRLTPPGDP